MADWGRGTGVYSGVYGTARCQHRQYVGFGVNLASRPRMNGAMAPAGATILVVDDDEEFRSLVTEVLLKEGFRVAGAANGAFALYILSSVIPDLILLDLAMPVMNGRQLLAVLATDPRLSAVPIVVLSGTVTSADSVSTHHVLRKPLQRSTLLQLVHRLVGEGGPWRGKH